MPKTKAQVRVKPEAEALIKGMLAEGKGYKEIIKAAHQRGLGCSTNYISKVKRGMSADPIMQLVDALRGMGVIEFHYTEQQVVVVRRQTLEIK